MTSGGARKGSGPLPQEGSGRSEKRGYKLDALPSKPYDGPVPDFPLPEPTDRELVRWAETWRMPQAWAWSLPSESWRLFTIGMYVRHAVRCEAPTVGATHLAQLHRLADQVGLTDVGLAVMGWKVAEAPSEPTPAPGPARPKRRLRAVVPDGQVGA